MSDELTRLTKPFLDKFIHDDGRGNSYVPHHIVTQRLIQVFGAPPRIELLREIYDTDKLTGVVMRLTVPGFEPVEEAGEADNPQSKTNGARLKDACSDAIKRCAMRLGCGLHLWSQKDYYLHDKLLAERSEAETSEATAGSESTERRPNGASPEPKAFTQASPPDSGVGGGDKEPAGPASSPSLPESWLEYLGVSFTEDEIVNAANDVAGDKRFNSVAELLASDPKPHTQALISTRLKAVGVPS